MFEKTCKELSKLQAELRGVKDSARLIKRVVDEQVDTARGLAQPKR